ncbi:MAG: CerR family C-terminal domain-containing protein [Deltaproteobacteria bacterium]|nr:CerR family C-terminal domain-containing protein [Deltaproteobacteria bacterium]MBW1817848.1 CerR family C-terminal domain-containing protein [Deltaproteobacteria bacterium]
MTNLRKEISTKDRILDEAEGLFAQKGYRGVTVREITQKAGCNLASVNYYFGSKHDLYQEVFRSRWIPRAIRIRRTFERYMEQEEAPTPAAAVRALARAFLEGPMTEEERVRHHQLMARELAKPSEAFELIAKEVMVPFLREFGRYLSPADSGDGADENLMLNIWCIMAMVIHFTFAKEAIIRITGRQYDPEFRARLVEHIIHFALNGIDLGKTGANP